MQAQLEIGIESYQGNRVTSWDLGSWESSDGQQTPTLSALFERQGLQSTHEQVAALQPVLTVIKCRNTVQTDVVVENITAF